MPYNRRRFLVESSRSALAALGTEMLVQSAPARTVSANEKVVLGVMGIRGRGSALSLGFALRKDCEVAYLADVDTSLFTADMLPGYAAQFPAEFAGPRVAGIEKAQGRRPKTVQDFRRILDDKSVDALVIATPDHWHAPATVWACQAGKDVYVEKPISFCPWEGRQMVAAARKYRRIVQAGTQSRSAACYRSAKRYIAEGKLGKIHLCRVCNMKQWANFSMAADGDPPKELDWDQWNGPAPACRYNATLRDQWHHFWRYSGGDLANDSAHQLDLARWLCGVEYPKSVYCTGGRFNEPGAAETPDTQIAVWDFDGLEMVFEQTLYTPYMLKSDMHMRNTDGVYPYWPQNAERIELYGEEGLMCVCRHGVGWQVFGRPKGRQPVVVAQEHGHFPDADHKDNFIACLRSRTAPNADIREGHLSALLAQMANISYRLGGRKLTFDVAGEMFVSEPEANRLLRREYRQPWAMNEQI